MLTVKLYKSQPALDNKNAFVWSIISCEHFEIYDRGECAEVVTYKTIPSKEGISWFISNSTSDSYSQVFVENSVGKTVYKYLADKSIPSLTDI